MSMQKEYTIIGIDGGGTKTHGALYRNGEILSEIKSGTTRIGAVGVGEACERTLNAIIELCSKAETEISEVDAVIVGLAGVWLEEEKKRAATLLKTLARGSDMLINDLIITSDAEIALEGAFAGKEGVITIIGTGSIALGKTKKNKLIRCGGWGIELDDEGSGAWIGREGLTAVFRAIDGRGEHTSLTYAIGDLYPTIKIEEPRTIVKAYAERAFEYQMLTPVVMKCAEEGDAVCLSIIEESVRFISELPITLAKKIEADVVNVALMGGIVDADTILARKLRENLSHAKNIKLVEPKGGPLDGAIALGERLLDNLL